jgi:uncharacterized membrane protein YqiK
MGFWTTVALISMAVAAAGSSAYNASASATAQKKAAETESNAINAQTAEIQKQAKATAEAPTKAAAAAQEAALKKRRAIAAGGGMTDVTKSGDTLANLIPTGNLQTRSLLGVG